MARKVIVEMHGGTISGVYAGDGESLDIVFVEAPKYFDDPDSEVAVKSGSFKGGFVYARESSLLSSQKSLSGVFAAADEREKRLLKKEGE